MSKDLEERVNNLEEAFFSLEKKKQEVVARQGLLRSWRKNLFRIALSFLIAFVLIGLLLQAFNIPNPWLRAAIPVLVFAVFRVTDTVLKQFFLKPKIRELNQENE